MTDSYSPDTANSKKKCPLWKTLYKYVIADNFSRLSPAIGCWPYPASFIWSLPPVDILSIMFWWFPQTLWRNVWIYVYAWKTSCAWQRMVTLTASMHWVASLLRGFHVQIGEVFFYDDESLVCGAVVNISWYWEIFVIIGPPHLYQWG